MKKNFFLFLYLSVVALLIAGGINRTASRLGLSIEVPFLPSSTTNQKSDPPTNEIQISVQDLSLQQGTVKALSMRAASIELDSGEILLIERRPWRFALESGLTIQLDDQVQLVGFFEGQVFEITQITNLSSGQSISLRDASGHPLWSGSE